MSLNANDMLTKIRELNNRLASSMTDDERYVVSEEFRSTVFNLDQWLSQGGTMPASWADADARVSL